LSRRLAAHSRTALALIDPQSERTWALRRGPRRALKRAHRIVEAASELFLTSGYGATSIEAVAQCAAISKRTFTRIVRLLRRQVFLISEQGMTYVAETDRIASAHAAASRLVHLRRRFRATPCASG
jgi:isopentenyl diphosphate isomerase/L-lactate dehydrogenase-like FMN-dependent dehydrogenase